MAEQQVPDKDPHEPAEAHVSRAKEYLGAQRVPVVLLNAQASLDQKPDQNPDGTFIYRDPT